MNEEVQVEIIEAGPSVFCLLITVILDFVLIMVETVLMSISASRNTNKSSHVRVREHTVTIDISTWEFNAAMRIKTHLGHVLYFNSIQSALRTHSQSEKRFSLLI